MNIKFLLILILSLLAVSINATATANCNSADTALTIQVGTTVGADTWENLVTCIAGLTGSGDDSITSLTIIIDSPVTTVTNPLVFLAHAKFAASYTLDIQISGSNLTPTQLNTNVYAPIEAAKAEFGTVKLTIDTAPLIANLIQIQGWISSSQLNAASAIKFSSTASQACVITDQDTLDACLVFTANQTAVSNCDESFLIYTDLTLTSTVPSDVNTCLGVIDQSGNGGKLAKLTIDYTGATTVAAGNLDFDTLLTNRKTLITDLNINLKSSNYKVAPVITSAFSGLNNLTLNYSNNGLNVTTTQSLANGLMSVKSVPNVAFNVILSDAVDNNNNLGNLKNLDFLAQTTGIDINISIFNISEMCTFNGSNFRECEFIEVYTRIDQYVRMICDGYTINVSNEQNNPRYVPEGKTVEFTEQGYVQSTQIVEWTSIFDSITDFTKEVSLPTQYLTADQEYELTYQATAKIDGNFVPIRIESQIFGTTTCQPEAFLLIDNEPVNQDQYFACENYTLSIKDQLTQGASLTSDTEYQWSIKNIDNTEVSTVDKTQKTLVLDVSELNGQQYLITLNIIQLNKPEIFVKKFHFYINECPAFVFINGALNTEKYTNCNDLVLSIGSYPNGIEPTDDTQYSWVLHDDNKELFSNNDYSLKQVTIPISTLPIGNIYLRTGINIPNVDLNVKREYFEITDGGSCTTGETTTDSSIILQISLALILIIALIL